MRRWVLLLVALAIAAGPVAFVPSASADPVCGGGPAPCIAVTVVGSGTTQYATPQDISDGDVTNQGCTIRRVPGGDESDLCNPSVVTQGLSIQALLNDVGLGQVPVQLIQVNGHADNPSTLTSDELASTFEHDWKPVFALVSNDISYERPLLDNENDTNANDNQITYDNGEMDVSVYTTGQVLHPTVTLSTTDAKIGHPITATATLPPGESAAGLTYEWDFYDGPIKAEGPTTTHTYAKRSQGTAGVSVTVERDIGTPEAAYGTSQPVVVDVGEPAKTPPSTSPPSGGSGTGNRHHPKVGPNKGKGRQAGAAPGRGGGANPKKPTATPSTTPTSPPAATAVPSGSAGGAAGAPSGPATAPSTGAGITTPRRMPKPPVGANFGAVVNGIVIDSATQPVAAPPSSSASQSSALSARRRTTQPFDARLLWWLSIPVLLGVGVLGEVRRPGSRRAPTA